MAVTVTPRLGLTRWDNASDPFTRLQMDDSHAALEDTAVGFTDSTASLIEGFVSWDSSTNTFSYCDGTEWHMIYSDAMFFEDLNISGDIIIAGTVDGRDLSVDGTKLDGIEAGADVTDSVNVKTAIEGISLTGISGAAGDEFLVIDATDGGLKAISYDDIAVEPDLIIDADGDTKIQVEESADEDKIRFDTAGVERAVIDASGLSVIGNITVSGTVDGRDVGSDITGLISDVRDLYILSHMGG